MPPSPPLPPNQPFSSTARPAGDGRLELLLVHLGAPPDSMLPGLVVELVVGPAPRTAVRTQAASSPRGAVPHGAAAPLRGFAGPGTLLVLGSRRDLLGHVLAAAPVAPPLLHVLVLP